MRTVFCQIIIITKVFIPYGRKKTKKEKEKSISLTSDQVEEEALFHLSYYQLNFSLCTIVHVKIKGVGPDSK